MSEAPSSQASTPAEKPQAMQGKDKVIYERLLKDAATVSPRRLPFQTTHNFDMSRDNDSTATKDGAVPTVAPLETTFEVEALDSTDASMDDFEKSLEEENVQNSKVEIWEVNFGVTNDKGQYKAKYAQVATNEISNDNDADDASSKDITCSVFPTPVNGWVTVPANEVSEVNYAFADFSAAK